MKITFLMNDGTESIIEDDLTEENVEEWADLVTRDDGTLVEVERILGKKRNRRWVRARDIKEIRILDEIPTGPLEIVEKGDENDKRDEDGKRSL